MDLNKKSNKPLISKHLSHNILTMCTAKKCCFCCCNVILASQVIVWFSFLAGLLQLILGFLDFSLLFNIPKIVSHELFDWPGGPSVPGSHGIIAIGINTIISIAWLISDALVLYGISKKKPLFYIPWLIVHITSQLVSLKFINCQSFFIYDMRSSATMVTTSDWTKHPVEYEEHVNLLFY